MRSLFLLLLCVFPVHARSGIDHGNPAHVLQFDNVVVRHSIDVLHVWPAAMGVIRENLKGGVLQLEVRAESDAITKDFWIKTMSKASKRISGKTLTGFVLVDSPDLRREVYWKAPGQTLVITVEGKDLVNQFETILLEILK